MKDDKNKNKKNKNETDNKDIEKEKDKKEENIDVKISNIMDTVYVIGMAVLFLIILIFLSQDAGIMPDRIEKVDETSEEMYVSETITPSAVEEKETENIRNKVSEGEYYVLEIQTLESKDEIYVTLCSIVNGKPDFKARSIVNVDKEPELSKWHTLLVGDTIKYYGDFKFDIVESTDKIN